MLVCHCHAVSDREIVRCVRDGATTRQRLAKACGAGSVCGGCIPVIDELIEKSDAAEVSGAFRLSILPQR